MGSYCRFPPACQETSPSKTLHSISCVAVQCRAVAFRIRLEARSVRDRAKLVTKCAVVLAQASRRQLFDCLFPSEEGLIDRCGVMAEVQDAMAAQRSTTTDEDVHLSPTCVFRGGGGGRIKLLCSFGGRIIPRPSDGALKYIGGETRVLAVPRSIPFRGACFPLVFSDDALVCLSSPLGSPPTFFSSSFFSGRAQR
jgi:hypothetical protein